MEVPTVNVPLYRQSVLTAAVQELTPRDVREADDDKAIEDWLEAAASIGVKYIQLSSALHPSVADVPAEALLDPVANHLDLRRQFDSSRAQRVQEAMARTDVAIADLGYFDNHLHPDASVRDVKFRHMIGVMEAAKLLSLDTVACFVGADPNIDYDQNLLKAFEERFVPILKEAKDRSLVLAIEQCPMPGWNTTDKFINNIAYTPGTWMKLHEIAANHDAGDNFRIYYDPSHSILIGQRPEDAFQILKDNNREYLISGFHAKGLVVSGRSLAEWGYHGQTVGKGDRIDGQPNPVVKQQANAWVIMVGEHELPGTAYHNPDMMLKNKTVDWTGMLIAAREVLGLDPSKAIFTLEHEYNKLRVQDKDVVLPALQMSLGFLKGADMMAANTVALNSYINSYVKSINPKEEHKPQGYSRQPYM